MSPDNKPFDPANPDLDQARSMLRIAIDEARLGLRKAVSPSAQPSSTTAAACSAADATAASRKATPPSTARPMPSAKPAASAAIATKSWSPRSPPAGIAAASSASSISALSSSANPKTFRGGLDWLIENGVRVIDLKSQECIDLLEKFIVEKPAVWNEDIGEE